MAGTQGHSFHTGGPGTSTGTQALPPGHPPGLPASITSKGSPSASGKTLDTSSWPQRPPWKALPTMVALVKRGLTWKAISPVSDRKLISNLGAS